MAEEVAEYVFGLSFGRVDQRNLKKAEEAAKKTAQETEREYKKAAKAVEKAQLEVTAATTSEAKKAAQEQLKAAKQSQAAIRLELIKSKDKASDLAREMEKVGQRGARAAAAARKAWSDFRSGLGLGRGLTVGGVAATGVKVAGAAAVAGAGAIAAATMSVIEHGKEIDKWRAKIVGTREEVQVLDLVTEKFNVDADNGREAVKTLRENLGELARIGTGPAKDSLGSLGLTLEEINGLPVDEQMAVLAEALVAIEDPAKRLSIAIELMGEDGAALLPVLEQGGDKIREMGSAARDSGRILSDDLIDSTQRLDQELKQMRGELSKVAVEIATQVIPEVLDFVDKNEEFLKQDLPRVLSDSAKAAMALAKALAPVVENIANIGKNMRELRREVDLRQEGRRHKAEALATRLGLAPTEESAAQAGLVLIGGRTYSQARAREILGGGRKKTSGPRQPTQIERDLEANSRIVNQTRWRARGEKFDKTERDSQDPNKKSASEIARAREQRELKALAEQAFAGPLGDEIMRLADRTEVTFEGVESAMMAAAKAMQEGANDKVVRDAALGRLGQLAGEDFKKKRDPLMAEFMGDEWDTDQSLDNITRGTQPQVLVNTTNNNFNFENRFEISGANEPSAVAREVVRTQRSDWESQVQRAERSVKIRQAR